MKKLWDLKKVFSNLEPEGQGRGIIMRVTHLLLLELFYTIETNFMYFFAHDCITYVSLNAVLKDVRNKSMIPYLIVLRKYNIVYNIFFYIVVIIRALL